MITFVSYNLKDYQRTADDLARYHLVEAVIRAMAPDVVAVQELPGHSQQRAEAALLELAEVTEMVCRLGPDHTGPVAVACGGHDDLALGLMWRPGIWAAPDSLRIHAGPQWWHALLSVELNLGNGLWIRHACYHAPPSGGGLRRPDEARRVVEAMAGSPGMVAADWNNPYYYRDQRGKSLGWPQPWWDARHPELADSNRAAAWILAAGGLHDLAVVLGKPRPVTTGHWPDERNGPRPIDAILATDHLISAIRGCFAFDSADARRASDHLPVGVRYDLEKPWVRPSFGVERVDYYDDPNAPAPTSIAPSANVVVVHDAGQILLIRRADNENWALPGGAMELGESLPDAARRETVEETGIHVEVTGLVGIYTDPRHLIRNGGDEVRQEFSVVLTARPVGGELTLSAESPEVRWVAPEDMDTLRMDRSMRMRIKHYLAGSEQPHLG